MEDIYKKQLLDHFRHPRNRGDLAEAHSISRGRNPSCGDEVEVGVFYDDGELSQVRFEGRGCSVCIASASMMTEAVEGLEKTQLKRMCNDVKHWFSQEEPGDNADIPELLSALNAVRNYPSRQKCAMLCWEALDTALGEGH